MIDFPEFLCMMSLKVILVGQKKTDDMLCLLIGYKVKIRLYTVCGLLHTNIDISSQSESENAEDEIREAFQVFDGVRFFTKVFSYYYCSIKNHILHITIVGPKANLFMFMFRTVMASSTDKSLQL